MADLQSPSADWPLATPWARTRRQKRRGEGRLPHWGTDRFLARFSDPRKLHCARQVARSAPVHSAGSQLPLRVLEMYQIVAAGDDSTPLRSEIKL